MSVCYEVLSFACLAVNKVRYLKVTRQGSYAVILLVPLLGSLTIAKFNGVSVHCFVVALFQLCTYMYTTFEYIVRILLHLDSLRKRYNFTEI